ncbi:hypothetical protein MASR1M42_15180 [Azonexus hydrophilus]
MPSSATTAAAIITTSVHRRETFASRITEDSPAGVIQEQRRAADPGRRAGQPLQRAASGGDLLLELETLSSVGAAASTSVRTRAWNTRRITDGTNGVSYGLHLPYNAAPLPKSVPVADFFTPTSWCPTSR